MSDRAVPLSANAKKGKILRRHVKPLIQLPIVLISRKPRLTCGGSGAVVARGNLVLPGGSEGQRAADISGIDLILDGSVPKCLCEIISPATEQLLNTRNC